MSSPLRNHKKTIQLILLLIILIGVYIHFIIYSMKTELPSIGFYENLHLLRQNSRNDLLKKIIENKIIEMDQNQFNIDIRK